MTDIFLDGKSMTDRNSFYNALAGGFEYYVKKSLGEEESLGKNLDAVYDLLTDIHEPVKLHIQNASALLFEDRIYRDRFLKMLEDIKNQNEGFDYSICKHETELCIENAYAKINLSLDVTGKLENGYHLVKMIMASISLHDVLTFEKSDIPGVRLSQKGRGPESSVLPLSLGEDNLIMKAVRALLSEAEFRKKNETLDIDKLGLNIVLEKNIPMAAGMAGGSADAAATLRAVNRLLNLDFSLSELCEIGVKLGADIPFCIMQGCYLSEGIGEILTPVGDLKELEQKAYIALVKPPIDVSTKYVYSHLDSEGVSQHPDVDGQIKAIKEGSLYGITSKDSMRNVLRDVTVPKYPIVKKIEDFLKEEGALNAMMSGSGPTVFALFDDKKKCEKAVDRARESFDEVFADVAEFI